MRAHTELFNKLTRCSEGVYHIIPTALHDALLGSSLGASPLDYVSCVDLLREVNDAQFNIISNYDEETGYWVRDATNASPLDSRISHGAPVIEANNALLRSLSRLRAVDFALQEKAKTDSENKESYVSLTETLRINFAGWCESLLQCIETQEFSPKKFSKICIKQEQQFNNILLSALYEANLTKGCYSKKEAEKLLARYRQLSALLMPARPLVLLAYDEVAKMVIRETHYPVTTKTDAQKQAIAKLRTCLLYPSDASISAHTRENLALQEADGLFVDRMLRDDTLLPSTARKEYITGLKNAFLVKVEVWHVEDGIENLSVNQILQENIANKENTLWIARMSTPVYHGSSERDASILEHTQENIKQLKLFCASKMGQQRLHICSLNTVFPRENEGRVIRVLKAAQYNGQNKNYSLSYLPCNAVGTFHRLEIDPVLAQRAPQLSQRRTATKKADRLDQVVDVVMQATQAGEIPVIQCFGGVDRTVTTLYAFLQTWLAAHYGEHSIINIADTLAKGCGPAEMASYLCPGAPGMLLVSKADNLFGRETFPGRIGEEYYRASSKERKKNRVTNCYYLQQPSPLQRQEYERSLAAFQSAFCTAPIVLQDAGSALLRCVKAIGKNNGGDVSSSQLVDLNLLLQVSAQAMQNSNNEQNMEQLFALSEKLNRESTSHAWKSLATACFTLACISLIVIGVLASAPTCGIGLVLTGLGSLGLATIAAKTAYSCSNSDNYFTGSLLHHKERGLARQFSLFAKTASEQTKNQTNMNDNPTMF